MNPIGGNPLTLAEAKDFIARFDSNGDGVLDRAEFVNAVASDSSYLNTKVGCACLHVGAGWAGGVGVSGVWEMVVDWIGWGGGGQVRGAAESG